jgi:predicted ester cyclase
MNQAALTDFGTRYAAAWSSQDSTSLASFYSENGSLTVNGGAPSVGPTAINETARGFMTAFPDMVVKMDGVSQDGGDVIFRWTWTGTNTGPGGTGKSVRINGYEAWTIAADGLIAESKGHFDEAEYQRQLSSGPPGALG